MLGPNMSDVSIPDGRPVMPIPQLTWAQYSPLEWYMWEPGVEYCVGRTLYKWVWWAQTMQTPNEEIMDARQFMPKTWNGFDTPQEAMEHCNFILREMRDTSGT